MTATVEDAPSLEEQIEALGEQVTFLAEEAREQRARRLMWQDLQTEVVPIAAQAMESVTAELDDAELDLEDVKALALRLARNTKRLDALLAQLEATTELIEDAKGIGSEAMTLAVDRLGELDRRGYFTFAEATLGVVDRVVTNFTTEDVEQLGDNVVLILETVKEMTQPEIMAVLYRMIEAVQRQQEALQAEPAEPPSLWQLLKKMRDPDVRRGLGRALDTVSAVSTVDTGPPRAFVSQANQETNEHQGGA
jgi:uncharacterized protein YjgD (DUF1641 family)